ncbi:MAG: glutamate-5-semialdehyde dehydrogenase [Planctomycetes bacterium]|nr:glutamate-5-semialdehyde dehydrogenase [Planctomycetota bacterium]
MVPDIAEYVRQLVTGARAAARRIASASSQVKNDALVSMADGLLTAAAALQGANRKDLAAAERANLSPALVDRLTLTEERIEKMAKGVREIVALHDPVGEVIDGTVRPNGLKIERVRVPIGVVGFIYESRPNVTADAAALCIKSGNAVILRGGKEAIHSNVAVYEVIADALESAGLDRNCVQMVNTPDRAVVDALLRADGFIDVIIPRGGEGLIRAVAEKATMPVIKHYKGVCHVYVDADADLGMAETICMNAKTQRPGVCNAMETMLVHEGVAQEFLPRIAEKMRAEKVELHGCERARAIVGDMAEATEANWSEEYLDLVLDVKVVGSVDEAMDHIARYGSAHTDSVVTRNVVTAQTFLDEVDSSTVLVNASTRFSDGGEFGLGAEIGISTDKLHARGPMGLRELTTYKWVVRGNGQIRT